MFIHLQFTGSCFDVEHYWLRNAVRSRCLSYLPCDGVHVDTSLMSGICTNMRRWTFKNRKSVNRWFFALKSILKLITVDWHHFIIRWAGYCTYECKTMKYGVSICSCTSYELVTFWRFFNLTENTVLFYIQYMYLMILILFMYMFKSSSS